VEQWELTVFLLENLETTVTFFGKPGTVILFD